MAELVREGAIQLTMALARGSSDSEVSEAKVLELNVLSADHSSFLAAVVAAGGEFLSIDGELVYVVVSQ